MKSTKDCIVVCELCALAFVSMTATAIEPNYSFVYCGVERSSSSIVPVVSRDGEWSVARRAFGKGLVVTTKSRRFGDAVEWVNELENAGASDTGRIVAFRDCDIRLAFDPDPVPASRAFVAEGLQTVVYAPRGSNLSPDEFASDAIRADMNGRKLAALFQGDRSPHRHYATCGGRSCDEHMPFFNVNRGERGAIVAIGWTGQWMCDFDRETNGTVRVRTGLEDCDFFLRPQEKVRLSSVVVLPYEDGVDAAQNAFRRLVRERYSLIGHPGRDAQGPLSLCLWGGVTSADLASRIDWTARRGLHFDYAWVDAGWYGTFTTPSPNEFEGAWWPEAGDWQANPNFHPDGLSDVAAAARRSGMKFLLWFEIERSMAQSPTAKAHPDWFLWEDDAHTGSGLLDLGNPSAWQWAHDTLAGHIRRLGIGCYRQDFNMRPLANWRRADAADGRKGLHEARHIAGLYRLWDALLAEFPHLLIDNCASGGRRIDIETLRRSVPLWRSDMQCPANQDPDVAQCQMRSISAWLPYHGTSMGRVLGDTYNVRSCYAPALGCNFLFSMSNAPESYSEGDVAWLARMSDEYRRVRPYLSADYYALTPHAVDKAAWCVMEFFDPMKGDGIVLAFRRAESPYAKGMFVLKGVDRSARYIFRDADRGTTRTCSGVELTDIGFAIEISERRASRLYFFKKE